MMIVHVYLQGFFFLGGGGGLFFTYRFVLVLRCRLDDLVRLKSNSIELLQLLEWDGLC